MSIAALLLLQTVASASGGVEVWSSADRRFQHRMMGEITIHIHHGPIHLRSYLGMTWWGSDSTNIEGSFLNLEANRVLERRHGAEVGVQIGPCELGGWIGRRGIEWMGQRRVWEKGGARDAFERGPPFPTIGYHDGLSPRISCYGVSIRGPLIHWHELTLPWPDYVLDVRTSWRGWMFVGTSSFGGLRRGTAFDAAVSYQVKTPVLLRVAYGHLEHPGFERPLRRWSVGIIVG